MEGFEVMINNARLPTESGLDLHTINRWEAPSDFDDTSEDSKWLPFVQISALIKSPASPMSSESSHDGMLVSTRHCFALEEWSSMHSSASQALLLPYVQGVEMSTLTRSFSSTSHLSIFSDDEESLPNSELEVIEEKPNLTPEEEEAFRSSLRDMLQKAQIRAQHNYDAAIAGHAMIAPHIWSEMDEIEDLRLLGEEARCSDVSVKVLMPCKDAEEVHGMRSLDLLADAGAHLSIAMISKDVLNDPRLPNDTTGDDIAHRTKVNALRGAKLLELIQPYDALTSTAGVTSPRISDDDFVFVAKRQSKAEDDMYVQQCFAEVCGEEGSDSYDEQFGETGMDAAVENNEDGEDFPETDEGSWQLKVNFEIDPDPTFRELQHIKTKLGHLEQQILPCDIALLLSSTQAGCRLSATTGRTPNTVDLQSGSKVSSRERSESRPVSRLFDIDDIAPDDGIPSFENPFSSLFGKCKPVPIIEHTPEGGIARHLRERFWMHEQLRASLMQLLPDYRASGRTAEIAARDLMSKIIERPEDPGVALDVDELIERSIDEGRSYAIAILQGFIDRCEKEAW